METTSDTSSFHTYSVGDVKELALVQNETYTLAAPGAVPARQDAPHLHHAVLDPTGKFILVPDLGSDLVRVYKIACGSVAVTEVAPIKAVTGSGPRHAAFAVHGQNTYLYTVNELSNTISGYSVSYKSNDAPEFTRLFDFSTHGPGGSVPAGTKSAEIVVSVSSIPLAADKNSTTDTIHSQIRDLSSCPRAVRTCSLSRASTPAVTRQCPRTLSSRSLSARQLVRSPSSRQRRLVAATRAASP